MKNLILQINKCKKCDISNLNVNLLNDDNNGKVIGWGNANPQIMLIGEAPSYYRNGKIPFKGKGVETILWNLFDDADVKTYATNIIKCSPFENNFNEKYAENCIQYLYKQIKLLNPKILIIFGKNAGKYFNVKTHEFDIWNEYITFKTYHPTFVFNYNRSLIEKFKEYMDNIIKKCKTF